MGWRVYYKQDGVTYYTKVYEDFDEVDAKVTVLKLLSHDLRISDIRVVEVWSKSFYKLLQNYNHFGKIFVYLQ